MNNKIGIYEFNMIPLDLRMETLLSWGRFLTNHFDGNVRCNLYQVNNFYLELEYNNSANEITEVNTFNNGERLTKYLDKIDVNELLDND